MSNFVSIRSGATALPEESIGHFVHDLIYQSGVLDPTTHWKVSEHNPQNMSVDISVGRGYFRKTVMTYHGYSDDINNVSINSNSSGNPRIDAIVCYVDLGVSPNANASNVLKFIVVMGTPASSPVPPDDTAIQSAIGAGNPFIRLANVYVGNGVSLITNSDITDTRPSAYINVPAGIYESLLLGNQMAGNYQKVYSANVSGSISLDCANYNVFRITMTGNITLSTPTNMETGQFIQIDLKQDATGNRTCTWFSGIAWPDGVEPTLTPTANKIDSFVIKKISSNSYLGYIAGQNL